MEWSYRKKAGKFPIFASPSPIAFVSMDTQSSDSLMKSL